jgi:lysophospholipid acyltransferase (LPLAT)-like uncharacterized protein
MVGPLLILGLGHTWKVMNLGEDKVREARKATGKVIYAFWHGRMLGLVFTHRFRGAHILISQHRDGELIAQVTKRLGYIPVRGSTTRGGTEGLFQMAERAREGDLGITPDGPRGPAYHFQMGAVSLAQRTGCPIVPIACSAKGRKVLKSWDGFIIPFPFTTLIVVHGDPIQVERGCDEAGLEAKRKEAEEALRAATVQADRFALLRPDL